jgi:hypothetical protein
LTLIRRRLVKLEERFRPTVEPDPILRVQVLALQKLPQEDIDFIEQNVPFSGQANSSLEVPKPLMARLNAALVSAAAELNLAYPFCAEDLRL